MRSRNLAALFVAGSGLLAACSGSGYGSAAADATSTTAPPSATATPPTTSAAAASPAAVTIGQSQLGAVLVKADGRTLYGFTNDTNGTSSCTGTCAQNWPPLIVSADWKPADGAKVANLHTVKRDDGQLQLAVGKWPLYTFAGDSGPGDVNGQGSLGKWFVVHPDGSLHKSTSADTTPPSSPPSTAMSGYGY